MILNILLLELLKKGSNFNSLIHFRVRFEYAKFPSITRTKRQLWRKKSFKLPQWLFTRAVNCLPKTDFHSGYCFSHLRSGTTRYNDVHWFSLLCCFKISRICNMISLDVVNWRLKRVASFRCVIPKYLCN